MIMLSGDGECEPLSSHRNVPVPQTGDWWHKWGASNYVIPGFLQGKKMSPQEGCCRGQTGEKTGAPDLVMDPEILPGEASAEHPEGYCL